MFQLKSSSTIDDIMQMKEKTEETEHLINDKEEYKTKAAFHNASIANPKDVAEV